MRRAGHPGRQGPGRARLGEASRTADEGGVSHEVHHRRVAVVFRHGCRARCWCGRGDACRRPALPPHHAARLLDAQPSGLDEDQLLQLTAEALGETCFRDNGRRAHGASKSDSPTSSTSSSGCRREGAGGGGVRGRPRALLTVGCRAASMAFGPVNARPRDGRRPRCFRHRGPARSVTASSVAPSVSSTARTARGPVPHGRKPMNPAAALHLTADRRRSTGQSHQALHPLLSGLGQGLSIPAARHAEQARLEAAVQRPPNSRCCTPISNGSDWTE